MSETENDLQPPVDYLIGEKAILICGFTAVAVCYGREMSNVDDSPQLYLAAAGERLKEIDELIREAHKKALADGRIKSLEAMKAFALGVEFQFIAELTNAASQRKADAEEMFLEAKKNPT